jgi:hypothetical protein
MNAIFRGARKLIYSQKLRPFADRWCKLQLSFGTEDPHIVCGGYKKHRTLKRNNREWIE